MTSTAVKMPSTAVWTVAVLGLLAFAWRKLTPRIVPGIPMQPFSRISPLGHLPAMIRHIAKHEELSTFFESQIDELGGAPIAQVGIEPGGKTWIVVSEIQEIADILSAKRPEFVRAAATVEIFKDTGDEMMIVMPSGPTLKAHRRILAPSMSVSSLTSFTPRIRSAVDDLVTLWTRRAELAGSTPFAAAPDLLNVTTDASASISFGTPLNVGRSAAEALRELRSAPAAEDGVIKSWPVDRPQLLSDMETLFLAASELVLAAIPRWTRFKIRQRSSWRKAKGNAHAVVNSRIAAARANAEAEGGWKDRPDNVIDIMISKAEKITDEALSDAALRDEAMLFLVAGSETTATTLCHALKLLSRHPEVQHKLHAELTASFKPADPDAPTYGEITDPSLTYLNAVVWESLRMSRTVNATLRQAATDTMVFGHPVAAGTQVVLLVGYASQRGEDPDAGAMLDPVRSQSSRDGGRKFGYWTKPVTFDPERWIIDSSFNPNAGPTMPFGGGDRGCFGRSLALLQLKIFLIGLSTAFFFDRIDPKHDTDAAVERVTRQARECFVRPRKWADLE